MKMKYANARLQDNRKSSLKYISEELLNFANHLHLSTNLDYRILHLLSSNKKMKKTNSNQQANHPNQCTRGDHGKLQTDRTFQLLIAHPKYGMNS